MDVGLFKDLAHLDVPGDVVMVRTVGYAQCGLGSADYWVAPAGRPAAQETYYSTNTKNGRGVYLREETPSTEMFGVIHDGAPTLDITGTETDNEPALASLFEYVRANSITQIDWANGIACTSGQHVVPDFVYIKPRGKMSGCKSIHPRTRGIDQRHSPLWFGYFSLIHTGHRPIGSKGPFNRLIDVFALKHKCSPADKEMVLMRPGEALNFARDSLCYVRSRESGVVIADGLEYELPSANGIRRVVDADPVTGIVTLDRSLGFETQSPPLLCAIRSGAADAYGNVRLSQGIRIDGGFGIYGYNGMGAGCGSYEGYFDISGDCHHALSFNALVFGFARYRGTWRSRALEAKFCSESSRVIVEGVNPHRSVGTAIVSIGEYARRMDLRADVSAPQWTGPGGAVQMQPGIGSAITAHIYAPTLKSTPLLVYADPLMPFSGNRCDIDIVHGAANLLVIAAADGIRTRFEAQGNSFRIRGKSTQVTAGEGAVILQGGSNNAVLLGHLPNPTAMA